MYILAYSGIYLDDISHINKLHNWGIVSFFTISLENGENKIILSTKKTWVEYLYNQIKEALV